jgi:hypothetical protein
MGYDTDRSYDTLYTGNRVTLAELAKDYSEGSVHKLPDVGNKPSFEFILRGRKWQGGGE